MKVLTQDNGRWAYGVLHDSLNRHVISLDQDKNGVLWVQEQNRIKAYYNGRVVANLSHSSGLVSKTINKINLSKDMLVVSTNAGVSVVIYELLNDSIHIGGIQNYFKENGLYAEFNSNAGFYKNELIVQSRKLIKSYNLSNAKKTANYKPRVLEFRANGKRIKLDSLVLSHRQNYISIDFASLIFGSQPTSYLYRLSEQGDTWQSTSGRTCDFQALAPGEYTFQIKANYSTQSQFGAIAELKFIIKPAFWQTVWFKFLLALIVLFLLAYPVYSYLSKRKLSLESDRNFAQLKMQALKAQMNPHFIFNSLNSIQGIVNNGEIELANQYIVQFSLLIRQSLNFSSVDYISLKNEVEFLDNYMRLEQLRFENIFEYSIKVEGGIKKSETLLPPMMLQIYIENAILHGVVPKKEGGMVSVTFKLVDDYLQCTIDDNGLGRGAVETKKKKVFTSRGTQLNKERAEIYNSIFEKDILIHWVDKVNSDNKPEGTRVELKNTTDMINALIVDDEKRAVNNLKGLLVKYCPDVNVTADANSIEDAELIIRAEKLDVVFLDVEMPGGNGFELIDNIKDLSVNIIFVTAFDAYAIDAFKANAVNYILKPIDSELLISAVDHLQKIISKKDTNLQLVLSTLNDIKKVERIKVPTMNGFEFIPVLDILYIQSNGSYSQVLLKNNKKIVLSKNIGKLADDLGPNKFFRIHREYIVNIKEINKYIKSSGGGHIVLNSGNSIPVATRRKQKLMEIMLNQK